MVRVQCAGMGRLPHKKVVSVRTWTSHHSASPRSDMELMLKVSGYKLKLGAVGWVAVPGQSVDERGLAESIRRIAETLGEIRPGRSGHEIEHVIPSEAHLAQAGSLSSKHGLEPLPLHTDAAHHPVPCRYLILACAEPGPSPTPTILLDDHTVDLTQDEADACKSEVFLVKNGRKSFYSSIKDNNRSFIRFDMGCMLPLSERAEKAAEAYSLPRNAARLSFHQWRRSDILVIDNWRTLHGRGLDGSTEPGRVLLRAMIG